MRNYLTVVIIIMLGCSFSLQARILNDSIIGGENFEKAAFRLWYPDSLKHINGLIILTPGHNGDGRNMIFEKEWQQLASKYNFGLVGCFFKDYNANDLSSYKSYSFAKNGSGQALLKAITKFSRKSGHKELEKTPMLMWGHSAGGQFNYEFACWRPERIIAFVVSKGGFYYTAMASKNTREVPGIFFVGENDFEARKNVVKGIFSMNRRLGAYWTFIQEPDSKHEEGNTKQLIYSYFEVLIPMRMNLNSSTVKLNKISEFTGYNGNIETLEYVKSDKNQNNNDLTVWLPDRTFAKKWVLFSKKNN